MADPPFDSKHDPQARSWGIYVKPEYREMGISRALYEAAFKILGGMGFKTMTTGVLISNMPGRTSLVAEGFAFETLSGAIQINELVEETDHES